MGEVDANSLRFWCDKIVRDPDLLAEDPRGNKVGSAAFLLKPGEELKTFCNFGVERICQALGYDNLFGKMANQIYDYVSENWAQVTEDDAVAAAKIGDLVLGAWKSDSGHGHVAMVYPDLRPTIFSGKWKVYCPWVANVGKTNDVMGANWAFADRPQYFRLMKVIV